MDNRSGLLLFGVFILFFVFAFVFGTEALANNNVMFGVLALIGLLVCVFFSLMNGTLLRQEGGALSVYYFGFSILSAIILIWYCTRCGSLFGWWKP